MFWPAVQPGLFARARIEFEAELGGDHNLFAERSERFADEFFVGEWAVHFCGIEECDAAFDRRPDQRDHFLLVRRRAIAKAHPHAAKPDGGNFQIAFSKFAFLHCLLLQGTRINWRRVGCLPFVRSSCLILRDCSGLCSDLLFCWNCPERLFGRDELYRGIFHERS